MPSWSKNYGHDDLRRCGGASSPDGSDLMAHAGAKQSPPHAYTLRLDIELATHATPSDHHSLAPPHSLRDRRAVTHLACVRLAQRARY